MVIRNFHATQQSRTGVLTEVEESIEYTSNGFKSIAKTLIPFCRQKTISFDAKSLKPFTEIFVYFDKQVVNTYVTPAASGAIGTEFLNFSDVVTPVAGSKLISDGVGNCQGSFTIPDPKITGNPKFKTGDVDFVLTADPQNRQVGDASNEIVARQTYADAVYSAKGLLDTQQETIIATRNAITRTTPLHEEAGIVVGQEVQVRPMDPLAQTFIVLDTDNVDEVITGAFLTSVDIFFYAKDTQYPVCVEIRNVVNGSPGPKILPFGRKTLQSNEVSVNSVDGSTATTFTFDAPVYVQGGTEYSICLLANTPDYKVWIADLGTSDVSGNEITDQPHVGVIFKSSNNTTWVPSPTQDLKFSLKRAKFDIEASGLVTFQNKDLPAKILRQHPMEMTDASTVLKVNHASHGMYSTSNNVTIDGVKSGASTTLNGAITTTATSITLTNCTNFDDTSGKYSRDASNVYYIKIDDEIISYTTISGTGISSATRGANSTTATSHANGATVELYQIHKVPLYDINKTHTAIANIDMDSYTLVLATTPVIDGAGSTSTFGGTVVTATENAQYDISSNNVGILVPPKTKAETAVLTTTATSTSGSETSFTKSSTNRIVPLDDNYYHENTKMVASAINETNEMSGTKSFSMPITMTSELDALSPVIDLQRVSMVAVANKVNKIDSSSDIYPTTIYKQMTAPEGDNHSAIYLTKKINLENAATSLRVLVDINRDADAEVKVLYKILRVDDAFDFDEMDFKFFNDDGTVSGSGGPDETTSPSIGNQYKETEYTAGVTDDGIGTPLEEFISFQIKIVMRTTNQARPPKLKNLRALALAT